MRAYCSTLLWWCASGSSVVLYTLCSLVCVCVYVCMCV
nr:MAG TPA: hypothetical protein [Caudoviricetes sp.]